MATQKQKGLAKAIRAALKAANGAADEAQHAVDMCVEADARQIDASDEFKQLVHDALDHGMEVNYDVDDDGYYVFGSICITEKL